MRIESDQIYHIKTKENQELLVQSWHIGRNFEWNFYVLAVLQEEDKRFLNALVQIGDMDFIQEVESKNFPLYIGWFTCPAYADLLKGS